MIQGRVSRELEAIVAIPLVAGDGMSIVCSTVVDTGFNGYLTLPRDMIEELHLPVLGPTEVTLADGSIAVLMLYQGTVVWEGQHRLVDIVEADGGPLLGMALMAGSTLHMTVADQGDVNIKPIM